MRDTNADDLGSLRSGSPGDNMRGDPSGRLEHLVPGDGRSALRPRVARMAGVFRAGGSAEQDAGALSGGRQRPSGPGRTDGGDVGPAGSFRIADRPYFDQAVCENGYEWWYVDALSADGRHGLTVIAFIGGVFSPYYALARARGRGDPEHHVAMNVALTGTPNRWAMTERGRAALDRSADAISIGRSAMRWRGTELHIVVDETTAPIPRRLLGEVVVRPRGRTPWAFRLDGAGRHRWHPLAPLCDIEVRFSQPGLAWSGTGYFDTNNGDEPLEAAFQSWDWTRYEVGNEARIAYDAIEQGGTSRPLSLTVAGSLVSADAPVSYYALKRSMWGIPRRIPCDDGERGEILETMVDAPFYARTAIRSTIGGQSVCGVTESLVLSRVSNPLVRLMLPFKTPRWPI